MIDWDDITAEEEVKAEDVQESSDSDE